MTRPGIEPRSPRPLANTLTAGPISRVNFVIGSTRVEHSCNGSIEAFYGGFSFSFDQLTAYLLIFFSTGVTGLAFSFFFFFFFVL